MHRHTSSIRSTAKKIARYRRRLARTAPKRGARTLRARPEGWMPGRCPPRGATAKKSPHMTTFTPRRRDAIPPLSSCACPSHGQRH
eukprot:96322-Pyramimonas_sp.AAC.1